MVQIVVVSEYFPNGSLEHHIYRGKEVFLRQVYTSSPFGHNGLCISRTETRPRPLPWETRLKISTGAAHCLAFLHSRKKAGLYRRYLTASKILLDSVWILAYPFLEYFMIINLQMTTAMGYAGVQRKNVLFWTQNATFS